MQRRACIWVLFSLLLQGSSRGEPTDLYPDARYDPSIPTLQQVVGHDWGEKISTHQEIVAYLQALAQASPRVRLHSYGESWEGRTLYYLVVASQENLARLEQIRSDMKRLAFPDRLDPAEASALIDSLPVIVWLAYGIHGNEISSSDAALLTAYHLLAARGDELADAVGRECVVILDPMQNPDGRDRFIHYFRQTRGAWPDPDPQAAEHNEVWPAGRTNHYLFDMNRDWFALTQPETQGRVRAYLDWYPLVYVDLHEMGSNETYYFPPPARPYNPEMTDAQVNWLVQFGRGIAGWFDRMGWDYFTGEIFDSFYPGYGEGWPMFQGSIGMTFEQGSVRGLVVRREDETTLHYRDSVQHHFISSLATCQTAAAHRRNLLEYFYEYRRSALQESEGSIREFIIPPGRDPNRAGKLASLLVEQGIQVRRATAPFRNAQVRDYYSEKLQAREFPTGTYVVPLAQPARRLATTLLQKHTPMDAEFVNEQKRRYEKRLPDEIYDITGWSLPLLYDVEAYWSEVPSSGEFSWLDGPAGKTGGMLGPPAKVAYLIPWGTNSAARALARLHRTGIRVYAAHRSLTIRSRDFPAGSLIIKVRDNPTDLHSQLKRVAEEEGVEILPLDSSWMDRGINLGSGHVRYLPRPRIAMAYNVPVQSGSVGATRFLLERVYEYPVTLIHTYQLPRADLGKYDVLILPDASQAYGGYDAVLGEAGAERLRQWARDGGTLISIGDATRWMTEGKVALLSTRREYRGGQPVQEEGEKETPPPPSPESPKSLQEAILPERELPPTIPGAILRVSLDTEHWLAFGYPGATNVVVTGRHIFSPLKLDQGRNVALYGAEGQLVLSGFVWDEVARQIPDKPYLMYQPLGRGHVVAFADDPNFRAFCDGLNLLFLNAIFLSPAQGGVTD